jgi:hypothetical protein
MQGISISSSKYDYFAMYKYNLDMKRITLNIVPL